METIDPSAASLHVTFTCLYTCQSVFDPVSISHPFCRCTAWRTITCHRPHA